MSKGGWQKGKVTGEGEILTHEETLQLLSSMARNGSVTAATTLLGVLSPDRARDLDDETRPDLRSLLGGLGVSLAQK